MASKRMLSRRISHSNKLNSVSLKAQLVWTWTLPYVDDFGCFTAEISDLKTEILPKNRRISEKDINLALKELSEIGLIRLYGVKGKVYQQYVNFDNFQTFRTDRERKYEHPKPSSGIPLTYHGMSMTDVRKLSKVSNEVINIDHNSLIESAKQDPKQKAILENLGVIKK